MANFVRVDLATVDYGAVPRTMLVNVERIDLIIEHEDSIEIRIGGSWFCAFDEHAEKILLAKENSFSRIMLEAASQ